MVRPALWIFCRKISLQNSERFSADGPLLIVANHPNSFLDAIIIGAQFPKPVHFLARGDAFHKPWHARFLRLLQMIPVYRLSEGRENLHLNEAAFTRSKEILQSGGIVLIFIEGICVHKHEMQPFKKGAARIALENKALKNFRVLPLGIAYDSFEKFGKEINIRTAKTIEAKQMFPFAEEAKNIRHFNEKLFDELSGLIEIPSAKINQEPLKQALLLIPGSLGYCIHQPLYIPIQKIIRKKTSGTVFYDSVLFGSLLFLYPVYLILLCMLFCLAGLSFSISVFFILLLPLLAKTAVEWRHGY